MIPNATQIFTNTELHECKYLHQQHHCMPKGGSFCYSDIKSKRKCSLLVQCHRSRYVRFSITTGLFVCKSLTRLQYLWAEATRVYWPMTNTKKEEIDSLGMHSHTLAKQCKFFVCFYDVICVIVSITPKMKQQIAPRPGMDPNDSAIFNEGGGTVVMTSPGSKTIFLQEWPTEAKTDVWSPRVIWFHNTG